MRASARLQVLTRPLEGDALARSAAAGQAPPEWYPALPRSPDEWRRRAVAARRDSADAWLEILRAGADPQGAAAERLRRVSDQNGIVVTTGQQPGLFGGPVYTWSKAISALALADELQRVTGLAVAPVFWAATDDSDFAEAGTTYVGVTGGIETLELPRPGAEGVTMAELPLDDVAPLWSRLAAAAGSAPFGEALEWVREAYGARATVGSAFVRLLRRALEPLGVIVLDASAPVVPEAARPVLLRALRSAAQIDAALGERNGSLRAAGYKPRVADSRGLSLVFANDAGRRRRIPIDAAARAADRSEALRPNVLLRPIVERELFPTVAYLAGPGELSYFAQVSAVAETLGVDAPLAVPRWSGQIVEPHIARMLERHGLSPDDLRDLHRLEGQLARDLMPVRLRDGLADARSALERAIGELAETLGDVESPPAPSTVVQGAGRDMARRLDRLERRILAAVKRAHRDVARDLATLAAALWPRGKPQERILNFVPMLARQGLPLFDAMGDRAREHAQALSGSAEYAALSGVARDPSLTPQPGR